MRHHQEHYETTISQKPPITLNHNILLHGSRKFLNRSDEGGKEGYCCDRSTETGDKLLVKSAKVLQGCNSAGFSRVVLCNNEESLGVSQHCLVVEFNGVVGGLDNSFDLSLVVGALGLLVQSLLSGVNLYLGSGEQLNGLIESINLDLASQQSGVLLVGLVLLQPRDFGLQVVVGGGDGLNPLFRGGVVKLGFVGVDFGEAECGKSCQEESNLLKCVHCDTICGYIIL
ncbi:1 family type VI secretion ATPase, putative [Babesia ovata]|uniref:1 family type VI secretion ATPase, putative n=1 Tax=Babesia ovata TaxID=189622 RepID=A0A2H6KE59_9APIC|nr:1 family type VI secretion ATPase, putative [Babesia ovata]GBE61281.1 1 family type VI secretion ATPase, putative [Babesia ovata]